MAALVRVDAPGAVAPSSRSSSSANTEMTTSATITNSTMRITIAVTRVNALRPAGVARPRRGSRPGWVDRARRVGVVDVHVHEAALGGGLVAPSPWNSPTR